MPEETVDEQEVVQPAAKAPSSIGKMLMIVLLAVVSSAGGGVVSFVLINRTLSAQAKGVDNPDKSREAEQEKIAAMLQKSAVLPLEPFVVNLADADAARYLRIKISLMIDDKSKVKEISENQPLQLKLRDVILQSLTAKTSQEIINEEGKNKLRHEIQEKVGLYFREPKLVDVMFTEFVIQL
ncbi:MAG TPA: flagellar basal body-associated FliL family protein [Terriglobia bacterium]|nr:flagellar basal body-associated FliL family protein [Terriglobia bacterium]